MRIVAGRCCCRVTPAREGGRNSVRMPPVLLDVANLMCQGGPDRRGIQTEALEFEGANETRDGDLRRDNNEVAVTLDRDVLELRTKVILDR